MFDKKTIADPTRFFRREAYYGWGYLIHKRKELTVHEEIISRARWTYWRSIKEACARANAFID
ncbi:MAG: hypothetical protein QHH12_07970 [Candidatus Bathyarchaeota archaeon]|nr:hypothetical protein [Candidatus Bathyarchaeota archaeon A05DMB-3]MDH7607672.1 hypothetical protein [Candidatus Bathyarchaeota archaeon]